MTVVGHDSAPPGARVFTGGHFPQLHLPATVRLETLGDEESPAGSPSFTPAQILSNEEIAPEHFLMRVHAPHVAHGLPGQFAMIRPAPNDAAHPLLPRPMAVYRYLPEQGDVEFVYRVVGQGTAAMSFRETGGAAEIVGPVGRGFALDDRTRGILIVGRGIGVCSLTALVDLAAQRGMTIAALLSGRMPDVVLGQGLIRDVGGDLLSVSDSEQTSHVDNVRRWMEPLMHSGRVQQAFVCGSNRLVDLTAELAAPNSVDVQISLEAHMACGLGYCHSCATGAFGQSQESPLVCQDGPVFRCSAVIG